MKNFSCNWMWCFGPRWRTGLCSFFPPRLFSTSCPKLFPVPCSKRALKLHPSESANDSLNNSLGSIHMFWEEVVAALTPSYSSSLCFIINHTSSFLRLLVWCAEVHCEPRDANKAKAARIYPCERQSARQAPVCLSASLCVSHLIGNN